MSLLWPVAGVAAVAIAAFFFLNPGSLGKRLTFGTGHVYYTPSITADEALRVGRYLEKRGLFKAGLVDARLTKEGSKYQLQLVCSTGHPDPVQDISCEVLAAGLADDVLASPEVEVHICDRVLRPTSIVVHRGRFGRRLAMNAANVFYMDGVEESVARSVAQFLADAGLFNDSPKTAQMNRNGAGFQFRIAVEVDPLTPEMIQGAHDMARDLSRRVLDGAPIEVNYCKGLAGALRVQDEG